MAAAALAPYCVEAFNTAKVSENKIHDDAVARRFGFGGGLVPGVDVYAYMTHLPVVRWGRAWLERGAAECRFQKPVYDGDIATERDARRSDHFIGGDPHDGPMPMDYFVWAAIGAQRNFVIDTGFTAEVAAARGRRHLRCPAELLDLVGLDRNTVADVILTHMHYDHVGTFHRFPAAQFHLQEVELHYTTGRHMRYRSSHAPSRWRTSSASYGSISPGGSNSTAARSN
jgi:hypothetical protein